MRCDWEAGSPIRAPRRGSGKGSAIPVDGEEQAELPAAGCPSISAFSNLAPTAALYFEPGLGSLHFPINKPLFRDLMGVYRHDSAAFLLTGYGIIEENSASMPGRPLPRTTWYA